MTYKTTLVTGANRGIGLGLVKELLKTGSVQTLFASYRIAENAQELLSISHPNLTFVEMDVDDDRSVENAVKQIDEKVGAEGLDLLVNNAGVLLPYHTNDSPNRALLKKQMGTNVVSLTIVTQMFLSLLRRSAGRTETGRASVVNISSWLASIQENESGSTDAMRLLAYRMSKTAVNMLTKTMSADLAADKVMVVGICPGWVKTRMGGPNAAIEVGESAAALVRSFYALQFTHSGKFFDRNLVPITY